MTEADKKLGITICERWPVDLADVQEIIHFVRASSSEAVQEVWSVSNKTSFVVFGTEEDAKKYVSSFPGSIGGGLHIEWHPVSKYVEEKR